MEKTKLNKREDIICKILFLVSPIIAYLQIPAVNTITSLIFIIVFMMYWGRSDLFRRLSMSFPLKIWMILTLYHCINALIKKVPEVNILDILHGFRIYSCLCIFLYWGVVDFRNTIKVLTSCFVYYLCISFVVCDFDDELSGRFTGVIYATALGQTAAVACFYFVYNYMVNKITLQKIILYFFLSFVIIVLTQSRNSLAMFGIAILSFVYIYVTKGKKNTKILLLFILGVASLFILYQYFINSDFAARMSEVSARHENSYQFNAYSTGTFFDDIVGDRLIYYVLGFVLFKESPLTGIGMWNFQYVTDTTYPLHSEYMVHLCEGGLIAVILWALFWIYIIYNVCKYLEGRYRIIAFFSIIQLLFCAIYARLFYYEFFYPLIGITLSIIWLHKNKKRII